MRSFIFDFDGVIIDSQSHWDRLSTEHLQKLIPHWTMEDDRRLKGHSAKDNYKLLVSDYNVTFSEVEFLEHITGISEEIYGIYAQLTDGVVELLARLQTVIHPELPSIASASRPQWLEMALARFNLRSSFGLITTAYEVEHGKPFPDVYLKAAEKINRSPSECIAVEDTDIGMKAAKAAGMFGIGFHAPGHDHQELAAADMHIDHFDELTDAVLASL